MLTANSMLQIPGTPVRFVLGPVLLLVLISFLIVASIAGIRSVLEYLRGRGEWMVHRSERVESICVAGGPEKTEKEDESPPPGK